MSVRNIFADESHDIYTVRTHADGPDGELPLTAEMLINRPSGDLFGMTMNAGMGWSRTSWIGTVFYCSVHSVAYAAQTVNPWRWRCTRALRTGHPDESGGRGY